jgi:Leucine-rich repeat (LRR) protein
MKSNIVIISIISVLGILLYLSNMYDKKMNADKIAMYKCENNAFVPFPVEYLKSELQEGFNEKEAKYQPKYNRKYKHSRKLQLDWNNLGLTALPNDLLKNHPCISYFNISKNDFTTIPTTIQDLRNLERLDLQHNKITSAKNNNIDYKQLKVLNQINLSHNLIDTLDLIPLHRTFHKLDVNNNRIKHINAIDDFNLFLTNLSISNNELSEFPHHLFTIRNLMRLNISHNKISGKVDVQNFDQLVNLNMNNQVTDSIGITSIILGEGNLENLIRLEADSNDIKHIILQEQPFYESVLKKLEVVSLNSNKLTVFPKLFYNCPSIRTLDLSHNKLGSLTAFTDLTPKQHQFYLSNLDKLGSVWFDKSIPSVEELDLSNNQIQNIIELNNIPNIQKLDLSHNQLTRFPLFIGNYYLTELNLSHNNIETLVHFMRNALTTKNFEKINLSHNKIRIFEKSNTNYHSLKELNLSHNQITTFHCNAYIHLEKLDLSNNNLTEIIYEGNHADFLKIKNLNLSNNPNLKDLPIELFRSPHLKTFNIKNTNLKPDLARFIIEYCKTNRIKLIK